MASNSAPTALQKKHLAQVQEGLISKTTTLRRRSQATPTVQDSSQQQESENSRLQTGARKTHDPVQQTRALKRPREEQFEPTLLKEQKRARNTSVRNLSPTQRYQENPPLVQTTNPTPSDPSQTSDITRWLLGVAKDTADPRNQPEDQLEYLHKIHRFLAENRTVQRKRSSPSIASSSQDNLGYNDSKYTEKLEANGVFMRKYRGELPEEAKTFNEEILRMLEREQSLPKDSIFDDDCFDQTMELIQDRNEAFVFNTISEVMIPNIGRMTVKGASHLDPLIQSFDEAWNNCKKITQTYPKPDSAIGFKKTALSASQTEKILPYLGNVDSKSDFRTTFYMLFAFLTFEVKRGNVALHIADRQNAHSMAVSVRGLVALFRLMGREQELHGKILTISFSFDDRYIRVYGYLPIIEGENTEVWRENIDSFDLTARRGQDKWKCYQ
ncbi:f34d83fd-8cf3-4a2e-a3b8-f2f4907736ab [Sclerotinia trifoliorum]|uniref:F34d83fd-8cf3-4a2e-a3b8-f2f4907736ab n=1 Tax=Sclerotinia trifoliorum TaxID=28548 RepID=A0A8H2VUX0_9HELO|nr:f34d83fd-8cf3-4a2e-a3b8-f2f4907736ab [Sclerotinia trifoliorum]